MLDYSNELFFNYHYDNIPKACNRLETTSKG